MPSRRYRKNAEECLDRAVEARKSEDLDAWLLIAEDWLRLAVEFDAAKQQGRSITRGTCHRVQESLSSRGQSDPSPAYSRG